VSDPYTDPVTGCLVNRLGLSDPAVLAAAEREIVNLAALGLARSPVGGRFDLGHLQEVHRRLFGVVYPWAGQLRSVVIAKGSVFCLPQYLPAEADRVFTRLAQDRWLRGFDRDGFVDRFVWYFGEVNALHPFREGNGRTQRVFFAELASRAGWAVDWAAVTAEENVAASAASFGGDLRLLRELLDRAVTATPRPPGT